MIPLIVTLGTDQDRARSGSRPRRHQHRQHQQDAKGTDRVWRKTDVISLTSATGSTFGLTAMFVVYMGLALVIHSSSPTP